MMPTYSPPEAAIRWTTTSAVFGSLGRHLPTMGLPAGLRAGNLAELDRITTLMGHPLGRRCGVATRPVIDLGPTTRWLGPMRFMTGEVPMRRRGLARQDGPASAHAVTALTYPCSGFGFEP
jgi:hypothetical protein